jgi:hypothetical protein
VHGALAQVAEAGDAHITVFAETCPHYPHFFADFEYYRTDFDVTRT